MDLSRLFCELTLAVDKSDHFGSCFLNGQFVIPVSFNMKVYNIRRKSCTTDFFRLLLRPARLLRDVQAQPEITEATLLLKGVPESYGTGLGAGTAMEESRYASRKKAVVAVVGPQADLTSEIILTY